MPLKKLVFSIFICLLFNSAGKGLFWTIYSDLKITFVPLEPFQQIATSVVPVFMYYLLGFVFVFSFKHLIKLIDMPALYVLCTWLWKHNSRIYRISINGPESCSASLCFSINAWSLPVSQKRVYVPWCYMDRKTIWNFAASNVFSFIQDSRL